MEVNEFLTALWAFLPIIAAIVLTIFFGMACKAGDLPKAVILFVMLILNVYFGVI